MSDLERQQPSCQPAVPKRRNLSWRIVESMLVLNELVRAGEPVFAGSIRIGLTQRGSCLSDRGNQHIGDWIGCLGLNLPRHKQKIAGRMVVVYTPPPGGVSIDDLAAAFHTPPGWDWSPYEEAFNTPSASSARESGHECAQADAPGCLHPDASDPVPGYPGDLVTSDLAARSDVVPALCTNPQVPAGGARLQNSGGEVARPRRKPRSRKRVDEDLDDLNDLIPPPSEESLERDRAFARMMAQIADIP